MSVRKIILDLPRSTSVPTVLIALDRFLAEPEVSGTWPEWNKIIRCPPSDLVDHPWSNLDATRDEHVDHEVSNTVDKGKGKEKEQVREVGEGEDEGEADTAMAGTVVDGGEGEHARVRQNQHPADDTSPADVASPAGVVSPTDQGSMSSLQQLCRTVMRKTHPSHNPLPVAIPVMTSTTCQTRINALTMKLDAWCVEFKSPVWSGFLPFLEGNRTATGF